MIMNIKKWLLLTILLAIVSIGTLWILSNQPNHTVNGETTVKQQTFYLGDEIYQHGGIDFERYYFHGFFFNAGAYFMQIGHYHGAGYAGGMSDIVFRADNNFPTFTLHDRTFTITHSTQDSVTLEWKEG